MRIIINTSVVYFVFIPGITRGEGGEGGEGGLLQGLLIKFLYEEAPVKVARIFSTHPELRMDID